MIGPEIAARPSVTIAVVLRNAEGLVRETLSSIVAQTYAPKTIIVVDGQSTDNTLNEIHDYASDIELIISESDNGVYDGMNKAASLATTEYIIYMNAGDKFYSSNSLNEAISLCSSTMPDIILGRYFTEDGSIRSLVKPMNTSERALLFSQGNFSTGQTDWACHQATITRVKYLIGLGGYDTGYQILADQDFLLRAHKSGAIFQYSDAIICVYRLGGISSDSNQSFNELIRILFHHGYMRRFSLRHLFWAFSGKLRSISKLFLKKYIFR